MTWRHLPILQTTRGLAIEQRKDIRTRQALLTTRP